MRPIHLTVSGLNSFREKQTVDFASLCEGGVFGIFGPTGSGKSSLLDAMTLALYGKVERAANNTQGIMNQAENELKVSLVFELGNANGIKTYKVERAFKRNDELRLKTANCRFLDMTEETIVLAEKMNEVNDKIEDLLGLTVDDFTRAVVLPQGKFAEFLQLKGADRRKMLQRLFNLEKYGDQLNEKLRVEMQSHDFRLKEIEAEQAGIGDASQDVLQKAEVRLAELLNNVSEHQQQERLIEKDFEEKKQVRQWQVERNKTEQALQKSIEQKASIQEKKEKLTRAEKADQIKPYLEAQKEAVMSVASIDKQYSELEQNLKLSVDQLQKFEEKYTSAKEEKEQLEPKLLVRQDQLLQAQKELEEISKIAGELAGNFTKITNTEKSIHQENEKLQKEQALKKAAIEKQNRIKDDLKKLTISFEKKEEIRKANEDKKEILRLEQSRQELDSELKQKVSDQENITTKKEKVTSAFANIKENLKDHYQKVLVLFHHVCEREKESDELLYTLKSLLDHEKQEVEQKKTEEIAKELRKQLSDGKACPVCGSLEHPAVDLLEGHTHDHASNHVYELEESIENTKGIVQELASLKYQLEQLSSQLVDYIGEDFSTTLPEVPFIVSTSDIKVTKAYEWSKELAAEVRGLKQDVLSVETLTQKESKEYLRVNQELFKTEHSYEAQKETVKELGKKKEKADREISKAITKWKDAYKNYDWDRIEQEQKSMNEQEKETIKLQESLEKSYPFIEEKETSILTLKDKISQMDITLAQSKSRYEEQEKYVQEKRRKVSEQIGEEDVTVQLNTVTKEIERIKVTENNLYKQWQTALKKKNETENAYTAIKQSYQESKQRLDKAQEKLLAEISNTRFSNDKEVEASLISKTEAEALTKEIEQFEKILHQLQTEKEKYDQLIEGKQLSEEEWKQIQEKREHIKVTLSQLSEEKGAAEENVKDLRQKHERYAKLEKDREKISDRKEQLGKLQSVFRGNAFVEFLAEEQLLQVSRSASERLQQLTRGRYAIEVDSNGGFVIRDDANGGVKRPVSTLSGGETFLTSLALALSLSGQIQLRGEYPLEFFFLDEGFGTLDQELLDTVITALEKLHSERLSVGVISHVPELRARLPRKLIVTPAEPSGRGSQVALEVL